MEKREQSEQGRESEGEGRYGNVTFFVVKKKKWWDTWWSIKGGETTKLKWEKVFEENNKNLIESNTYIQKMGNFLRPPLLMPYECTNVRVTREGKKGGEVMVTLRDTRPISGLLGHLNK